MKRLIILLSSLLISACQIGETTDYSDASTVDAGPPDAMRTETGGPCEEDVECVGDFCLKRFGNETDGEPFPDGYCSEVCAIQSDCDLEKEICVAFPGLDFGACHALCDFYAPVDECEREGYSCQVISNFSLKHSCLPE